MIRFDNNCFKCESFDDKQSSFSSKKIIIIFLIFYLEHIDVDYVKRMIIFIFQYLLFCFLFTVGFIYGSLYTTDNCVLDQCYFSTYARLAKLQATSTNSCSDFTDPVCFLQRSTYDFFFRVRLLIIYYLWMIIAMVYIWHRTVRLSYCFFVLLVVTMIVFCTDLILYCDQIAYISSSVCLLLLMHYPLLMAYLSQNVDDPLSLLCGHNISSNDLHEYLLNGNSKRARFYRWAKTIENQWNIKEEKLIISIIFIVMMSIGSAIVLVYILPIYSK